MKQTIATDSDLMTQYAAVRDGGVGVIDLSARGRISVSGSEAVMFLNGLITNDLKTLGENRWMPAAFPNVQGRLLAVVRVVRRAGDILLDTEALTREKVLQIIGRFTLAGDFRVTDLTDSIGQISLQGRGARDLVEKMFGVKDLPRDGVWQDDQLTIVRATHTGEDGYDVIGARETFEAIPVSERVAEILRIEAGIARYGRDMDETNVVTETNLDDAVSFTKGCYLGQEIIIRIKHRGHVAKKLTGIRFETDREVEAGAVIRSVDDKDIGRVTSSTFSPRLGTTVGLGYVRYEQLTPGTPVAVDGVVAVIAELPLVRGSWLQIEDQ
jgi:folate-binding protein YgfZ